MLRAAHLGPAGRRSQPLVEFVDRPRAGVLAPLPRPDDDLALRPDSDVLDAVLVGLWAQDERRVADPREERADDRRQHVDEDEGARAPELAGDDGGAERARRVEAGAGEGAEGHDAEAE